MIAAHLAWGDRRALVLGKTSSGHQLLEGKCEACHQGVGETPSELCRNCHASELTHDIHPASLFDNQERWGATLEVINARDCVVCHQEHREADVGFTAKPEMCWACHPTIGTDAPSHAGFAMSGCLSCHNYHFEATIEKVEVEDHLDDPALLETRLERPAAKVRPASTLVADAPESLRDAAIEAGWRTSAHATDTNCSACHADGKQAGTWTRRPNEQSCLRCHSSQVTSFQQGKHGIRAALGLGPLVPNDEAVGLTMHDDATRMHGCPACHGVHELDLKRARVSACLDCHADTHSQSYMMSPHGQLFFAGRADAPTCATCHLPAREIADPAQPDATIWVTSHNNSATMRPPERMLEVCMRCHGLAYAWASLRDRPGIKSNFSGAPPEDSLIRRYIQIVRSGLEPVAP